MKTIAEILKELNLSPEEMEKHRDIIDECVKREAELNDVQKKNAESLYRLDKECSDLFNGLIDLSRQVHIEMLKSAIRKDGETLH